MTRTNTRLFLLSLYLWCKDKTRYPRIQEFEQHVIIQAKEFEHLETIEKCCKQSGYTFSRWMQNKEPRLTILLTNNQ